MMMTRSMGDKSRDYSWQLPVARCRLPGWQRATGNRQLMARYIQRISLLGKERWIGWEIDGVGTELPGLTLADRIPEEELRARGIKEFTPLSFEMFLGMNADAG